jgi:hypothetical protein
MVWLLEIKTYDGEYQAEIYELPHNFFELVDGRGFIQYPQDNLSLFLTRKKMPRDVFDDVIDYDSIVSVRIYKDIRHELAEVFFGRCLEEHKAVAEDEKMRKRDEMVAREASKKARMKAEAEAKKMAWDKRCSETPGMQCEECRQNLFEDEYYYNCQRRLIRLCHGCSRRNVMRNGKIVRCQISGCENPVIRSRFSSKPFKWCTGCYRK